MIKYVKKKWIILDENILPYGASLVSVGLIVVVLIIMLAARLFMRQTELKMKEKALSKFIVPTSRITEEKCEG